MSKINTIIAPAAFELVREQVCVVLAEEYANQDRLTATPEDEQVVVYMERFAPPSPDEPPMVNVALNSVSFAGQHPGHTKSTITLNIDCYCRAKASDADPNADSTAMLKLQAMLRICKAIIEDPQYKKLGFEVPFIENRKITSAAIANPNSQDGTTTVMGRLVLEVQAPDNYTLLPACPVVGVGTTVKLHLTDKGFLYTSNYTS